MNYMKGYNNRERRRRRRSRFSKGSDNYIGNSSYSSRSKYRSSMGQAVSGRWIVCLIAVIVLIAVGAVCLVQAEFGDDEQPKGQRLLRPEQKCQRSGDHDQRRGEEDQEQRGSPIGLDGFGTLPQLRLGGGVKGVLLQSVPGLLRGLCGLLRGAALFRQGG